MTMVMVMVRGCEANDDVDYGDGGEHEDVQVYAELTITCLEEGKFWIITGNLPTCCLLVYKYKYNICQRYLINIL